MPTRTLELRLYPTQDQHETLGWHLCLCRRLYNLALEHRQRLYRFHDANISKTEQQKQLVQLKQDHPRFQEPSAQAVQHVLKRLDQAFENFFNPETDHAYPNFKGRAQYRSMTFPQNMDTGSGSFRYRDGEVYLSKVGWVRAFHEDKPPWYDEDCIPKTCTVKEDRHGDWWTFITFEVPDSNLAKTEADGDIVGVDAGIKDLLTLSDGTKVPNPRYLEVSEDRLKKAQRDLSRKEQGSNNWHEQREYLAKLYRKIARQREDYLHKVARWLAENYKVVAVEDNLAGLAEDSHAKSVQDAGWGKLYRLLEYKLEEHGGRLVKVDQRHTTSDCHRCGERTRKPLWQREHDCPNCGLQIDRDQNAALEIRRRAIKQLEDNDEPVPAGRGESTPQDTRSCRATREGCPVLVVE